MTALPRLAETDFETLVEAHRNELRLHCYRMLGSSHDCDDVLQDTLTRAWRSRDDLKEATAARAWLYRIATHQCLDELRRRRARAWLPDTVPATAEPTLQIPSGNEDEWIEPFPSTWLGGVAADPAQRYELNESVALAFIAALQHLTAAQRAVLLLRDVVGLSAEETAQALEMSVSAANSTLFRARTAVEERVPRGAPEPIDPALFETYLRAWHERDIDAFISVLHRDVKTTMPPSPMWVQGLGGHDRFYRPMFSAMPANAVRTVVLSANGQAGHAYYRAQTSEGPHTLRGVDLLEARDGKIIGIHHFMVPALFPLFGLKTVLP